MSAFNFTQCILSSNFLQRRHCREQCTLDTCPLELSFWDYRPSLVANGIFLSIFALSWTLFLLQAVYSKRFLGFTIAMLSGCILEVLGYAGRIWAYYQPFIENPFLLQIVTLTIAPAFLAAGIYFCLSRIVTVFGADNSRIKPLSYPRIFIPCDFFSLVLQATGGGMASAATHANRDPTPGNNIMVAGLAFQAATLAVFIALSCDFGLRMSKRAKKLGVTEALDQKHAKLRGSFQFRGFLAALSFATLCIFTRSVYRVAELSEGWTGHLIKTQKYFIGLEGAIVGTAVLALNAYHPGICFREGYLEERGAFGFGRRKKAAAITNTPREIVPVIDDVREI